MNNAIPIAPSKTGQSTSILDKLKSVNWATFAPLIALFVLIAISSIASEHFLMPRNLTNILRQVSYTGIIALGMTFVIIAGGIDLSVALPLRWLAHSSLCCLTTLVLDGYLCPSQ